MDRLCKKEECTGCLSCYNSCNINAIDIYTNEQGFNYPRINITKCIECGKCTKACPIINPPKQKESSLKTYATWNKDYTIRKTSSSGGFFTIIATKILQENGYVVGASFDKDFNVNHIIVDNINSLHKLRGSKYIQSNIGTTYKEITKLLKSGKKILFTGTPCQITGLKSYLHNKEYPNLYTIDLVCHGTPSPLIFQDYKKWLEKKYNSSIKDYQFRDKKWSWIRFNTKATFANNTTYWGTWEEDIFMRGFLRDLYLRESCYNCHYTNLQRQGDITIADFWGYIPTQSEADNKDTGISLVIINSDKGNELFETCKKHMVWYKKDLEIAIKGNKALTQRVTIPNQRNSFWQTYFSKGFTATIPTFLYPDPINLYNRTLYKYGKYSFRLKLVSVYIKIKSQLRRIKKQIFK